MPKPNRPALGSKPEFPPAVLRKVLGCVCQVDKGGEFEIRWYYLRGFESRRTLGIGKPEFQAVWKAGGNRTLEAWRRVCGRVRLKAPDRRSGGVKTPRRFESCCTHRLFRRVDRFFLTEGGGKPFGKVPKRYFVWFRDPSETPSEKYGTFPQTGFLWNFGGYSSARLERHVVVVRGRWVQIPLSARISKVRRFAETFRNLGYRRYLCCRKSPEAAGAVQPLITLLRTL